MRQAQKEKEKKFIPNSVHTRPQQENSEKNIKKSRKIIKPLPGNFFSQNGMRYDEKEKKKFQSRITLILDPGKKISKNILKKFKKV